MPFFSVAFLSLFVAREYILYFGYVFRQRFNFKIIKTPNNNVKKAKNATEKEGVPMWMRERKKEGVRPQKMNKINKNWRAFQAIVHTTVATSKKENYLKPKATKVKCAQKNGTEWNWTFTCSNNLVCFCNHWTNTFPTLERTKATGCRRQMPYT